MIISIQFSGVLEYSFIQMQNKKKEKPKQKQTPRHSVKYVQHILTGIPGILEEVSGVLLFF